MGVDRKSTAGGRHPVPLKDNMFAALIPNRFPIKLVAYDAPGRVVGIQTYPSHGFAANLLAPPATRKNFRKVDEVRGPNGSTTSSSTSTTAMCSPRGRLPTVMRSRSRVRT